jgi:hypothetical protein
MVETFKDIENYEGLFQISNFGNVKSLKTGKLFKIQINKKGYCRVSLFKNKKYNSYNVHRLVMLVFVGPSKLQVNHKDGNKLNNRLDNLEYCTAQENVDHAWSNGLGNPLRGVDNGNAKLNDKIVLKIIELLKLGKTQ